MNLWIDQSTDSSINEPTNRRLFPAAWTTATRCSSSSRKDWWTGCSRFRTPLPVWWPVLDAPTIYCQCSVSYTGYQCASVATCSSTSRLAFRHRTWPTTATLLPMLVSGGCAPQRAKHASWRGHTAPWRQSVLGCWTRTMEQSSIAPDRRWLIVQRILAVVKDISVWTVGSRRSVNFIINCTN